jgi:hypothetical protein
MASFLRNYRSIRLAFGMVRAELFDGIGSFRLDTIRWKALGSTETKTRGRRSLTVFGGLKTKLSFDNVCSRKGVSVHRVKNKFATIGTTGTNSNQRFTEPEASASL